MNDTGSYACFSYYCTYGSMRLRIGKLKVTGLKFQGSGWRVDTTFHILCIAPTLECMRNTVSPIKNRGCWPSFSPCGTKAPIRHLHVTGHITYLPKWWVNICSGRKNNLLKRVCCRCLPLRLAPVSKCVPVGFLHHLAHQRIHLRTSAFVQFPL